MSLNSFPISYTPFSFSPQPSKHQSFSSSHVFVPDFLVSFLNPLFPLFVSTIPTDDSKAVRRTCKRQRLSCRRWTNWYSIGNWVSIVPPWLWIALCTTFYWSDMTWLLSCRVRMFWQDQESLWLISLVIFLVTYRVFDFTFPVWKATKILYITYTVSLCLYVDMFTLPPPSSSSLS